MTKNLSLRSRLNSSFWTDYLLGTEVYFLRRNIACSFSAAQLQGEKIISGSKTLPELQGENPHQLSS